MGMTKQELIEQLRTAEHNCELMEETLNQQAENVKDWAPARHGRWISEGYFEKCSVCNSTDLNAKWHDFCPHCGAKMDLELAK